jgi:hypothetical protein
VVYALIPLFVAGLCLGFGKRRLTLVVMFGYLCIEGFLKLMSNYNRVVHLGMDIIVLTVAAAWAADAIARRRALLPDLPWIRWIGLYALWIVLQLFNPYSPGLIPALASFKLYLTMVPLYFIAAAVIRTREDVLAILTAMVGIALVPYLAALVQYPLGPRSVLDLSPRYWQNISYMHEWRPFGTSATPGGTSVIAFLVTPLAVALLLTRKLPAKLRWLAGLSIALAAGVFVVAGIRQVFLGCIIALLSMGALVGFRQSGRGVFAVVMVALLGIGAYVGVQAVLRPMANEALRVDPRAPPQWRESDVTTRLATLANMETYLTARHNAFQEIELRLTYYPLGSGLGRTGPGAAVMRETLNADPFRNEIETRIGYSENFFATMLQEMGIPGTLLATVLLIGMPVGAARLARRSRDPIIMATSAAIAGVWVGVLAMSWGSQAFLGNPITAVYWMLAGVLATLRRLEAEAATSAASVQAQPASREPRPLLA